MQGGGGGLEGRGNPSRAAGMGKDLRGNKLSLRLMHGSRRTGDWSRHSELA
jgi:hypothetical protein